MKHFAHLFWVLLLAVPWNSFAQTHDCATDSILQSDSGYNAWIKAFAHEIIAFKDHPPSTYSFKSGDTSGQTQSVTPGCQEVVYIIPLVVHIDTSGGISNVSDTQVVQQVQILNDAYFSHGIRFVLAKKRPDGSPFSGINRFGGSFDYRYSELAESYAASGHYYDPDHYANLYVAPQILSLSGGYSGINGFNQRHPSWPATNPASDLIVVIHTQFGNHLTCSGCGTINANSRGSVPVHEFGHYLGLLDQWQGGCNEGYTAATCALEGDLCCDTRPITTNYACPPPGANLCPTYHLAIGDNHENFMGYTGQACVNNFTADQESIMRASLELYRSQLISPQNLNVQDLEDCFASAWFDAELDFFCDSGAFNLHAIAYNSAISYHWTIQVGSTVILDTTLSTHLLTWTYNQPNLYDINLEIIYGNNDTARVTRKEFLHIADCGTPMASEKGNWYFGEFAGLKFTANGGTMRDIKPSDLKPSNINTSEGSISHSDDSGNLLFYGAGTFVSQGAFEVYNRNYVQMPGSPIIGDFSSSQAGAVVKVPSQSDRYYLFTVSGNDAVDYGGFRYSIVDMTLDGGNGDIDPSFKNVPLKAPSGSYAITYDSALKCSEMITVIPKCDDSEFWVLVADNSDTTYPNASKVLVYLVDASGVQLHHISDIKIPISGWDEPIYGFLKASPNGNWVYTWGMLLSFDKSNGNLALYRVLADEYAPYSASFSPNSELLYTAEKVPDGSQTMSNLYQYNLKSSSDSLNRTLISQYPQFSSYVSLQLGPDDKIYLSKQGQSSLAVIESPDNPSLIGTPNNCGYKFNGPVLSSNGTGGRSNIGLPNVRDAKLASLFDPDFLMVDSACGTLAFFPNSPCVNSYYWDFGDGDTSNLKNPTHTYQDTGAYTILLIQDGTDTIRKEYYLGNPSQIAGDSIVCVPPGSLAIYSIANADPLSEYTWQIIGGTQGYSDAAQNIGVLWDSTGKLVLHQINPLNGCVYSDTLEVDYNTIDSNTILLSSGTCFPGAQLAFNGSTGLINGTSAGTQYQWEKNTGGSGWQPASAQDTSQNFNGLLPEDSTYFRRKVFNQKCENVSDSILVFPNIAYDSISSAFSVCADGQLKSRNFPVSIFNRDSTFYEVKLYSYEFFGDINAFEYRAVENSWVSTSLITLTHTWDYSEEMFYEVVTPCGSYYSDTFRVYECFISTVYGGWQDPAAVSVSVGDTIRMIAKYSHCEPDAPDHGDAWYKWQQSGDTIHWTDVNPPVDSDTLQLIANRCNDGVYYRRAHFNPCTGIFTPYTYSASAKVSVSYTVNYDLWSKDAASDVGNEPNMQSINDYWNSPDIWNNVDPNIYSANHQNPEYKNYSPNRVFVRIRNKGQGYSQPAKVFLYWTVPSTREDWDEDWRYNLVSNGFYNEDSVKTYPLGSEINDTGIVIGPLAPNSDTVVSYDWWPPNPAWYYYWDNGTKVSAPERMLCFLSRIEECEDSPYGLTTPEETETTVNVRNNNNIVTKNVTLFNKNAGDLVLPMTFHYPVLVGRRNAAEDELKIKIEPEWVTTFFDYAEMTLVLDDELYSAWLDGGEEGTGFDPDDNRLVITDPYDFEISNIQTSDGDYMQAVIEVTINSLPEYIPVPFAFKFTQYSGTTYTEDGLTQISDGGVYLQGIIPFDIPSVGDRNVVESKEVNQDNNIDSTLVGNRTVVSKDSTKKESVVTTKSSREIIAYPNPFTHEVTIQFTLDEAKDVGLELFDAAGAKVMALPVKEYAKGMHRVMLNGSHLAPGVYLCRVQIEGRYETLRLVIAR